MKKKALLYSILLFISASLLGAADSSELLEAGQALYRAGQYEKALAYLKKAVQADPGDWQAYEALGDAYVKLEDHANARTAYQRCLQLHPDNPTVQVLLDNLSDSSTTAQGGDRQEEEGITEDQPAPQAPKPQTPEFKPKREYDTAPYGSNRINRARLWWKAEGAYNFSVQNELLDGASAYNASIAAYGFTGQAAAGNHGVEFGGELGFLLGPNSGIALGARLLRAPDFHLDVNYEPGVSIPDFQTETFQPWALPLTLDYYFFMPDQGGRFFLSAGVGYYFATVQVEDSYDFYDAGGPQDHITGSLNGGNVGFQVSAGREFALGPNLGLSIFARGRYCRISNFRGTLSNDSGQTGEFGLATASDGTLDIDQTPYINAASGEKYTTLDFTGFDAGLALSFYTY